MGLEFENIEDGKFKGQYHVNYKIKGNPKVSIVIPNMDHIEDLSKCIESILKSTYFNYEIVIVENNSKQKETFEYYEKISSKYKQIKIAKFEIKLLQLFCNSKFWCRKCNRRICNLIK